jgi:dUTP pyrophosphatase
MNNIGVSTTITSGGMDDLGWAFNDENYVKYDSRTLKLLDLFKLQDGLNKHIVHNWKAVLTEDHFKTQIIVELGEMLGTGVDYKWWKKSSGINWFDLKMEAIDIIHFVISAAMINTILHGGTGIRLLPPRRDAFTNDPIDKEELMGPTKYAMIKEALSLIEYDGKLNHTNFNKLIGHVHEGNYRKVFVSLVVSTLLTEEELSAYYVAKHTLNNVRQNYGYKDGTYVKERNGVSDNEVMTNHINRFLMTPNQTLKNLRDDVERELINWQTGL